LVAIFAAVILSVLAFRATTEANRPKFYTSGDPLPLKLVGVQIDGAEAMYSPDGELMPEPLTPQLTTLVWDKGRQQRDFVFESAGLDDNIHFRPFARLKDSEEGRVNGAAGAGWLDALRKEKYVAITSTFPREIRNRSFLGFLTTYKRVKYVDLTIEFYEGPPGKALLQFEGPYTVDKPLAATGDAQTTLTLLSSQAGGYDAGTFVLKSSRNLDTNGPIFAYDKNGKRHQLRPRNSSSGRGGTTWQFASDKLSHRSIVLITIDETPKQHTYHNICVNYPDAPPQNYADFLEDMAKRLGVPVKDAATLANRQFQSRAEVISVLDLVCGPLATNCWLEIQQSGFLRIPEDLTAEESRKIRDVAARWVKTPGNKVYGAALGLWAGFPEFVEPALEVLEAGGYGCREISPLLARRASLLSQEHLDSIVRILKHQEGYWSNYALFMCLRFAEHLDTTDALLELAQTDKVWLWWEAIGYFEWKQRKARPRLLELAKTDATLQRRVIQVLGADKVEGASAESVKAAMHQLPELFSLKLLRVWPKVFGEIRSRVKEAGDPETATPLIIRFLQDLYNNPGATQMDGRGDPNAQTVILFVRILNSWHDIDIGSIGTEKAISDHALDWPVVVEEAVHWSRTGGDPANLPVRWKPQPDDLRIIFRSLDAPELSLIGVAEFSTPCSATSIHDMRLVHDFVRYQVNRSNDQTLASYVFDMALGTVMRTSRKHQHTIHANKLPAKLPIQIVSKNSYGIDQFGRKHFSRLWVGDWEVWAEKADDEQSVLSGTKLFENWWQRYVSQTPLNSPQPRVYHQHTREQIELLLRRQRDDRLKAYPRDLMFGWTPAQLAMREVMDLDPRFWEQSWHEHVERTPKSQIVAAWQKLLERDDLTPRMRVYANWRIGMLLRDERDNQQLYDQAMEAFGRAWLADPELITEQTVNAAINWVHGAKTDADAVRRRARVYRFLHTCTEAQLRNGVDRPSEVNRHGLPLPDVMIEPERREDALRQLKRSFNQTRQAYKRNLESWLESLADRKPDLAREFLRQVSDISPEQ